MARTLVVGYDGSHGAELALVKAIELAKLEAARIVVVFAFEIPAAYGGETGDYRRAVRELAEAPRRRPLRRSRRQASSTPSSSFPNGRCTASSASPSGPARA